MDNMMDILLMKSFDRMRNKAQMFSSLADDHYHTRLVHSLEVNQIALQIIEKLKNINPEKFEGIDENITSRIALLHDIGHTPYGHIGERTLHKICSGTFKIDSGLDFKRNGVQCGFKHNINSGLLYAEYLRINKIEFDEKQFKIIDGIIKHTNLCYKNEKKLDYGLNDIYVEKKEDNVIDKPKYIEGLIVSYADEIAQMCSDYVDIHTCNVADVHNAETLNDCYPYKEIEDDIPRNKAKVATSILINDFVAALNEVDDFNDIINGVYCQKIKEFDEAREKVIRTNYKISIHDSIKEKYIIELYKYYYNNPQLATPDLLFDFLKRVERINVGTQIKSEIKLLRDEIKSLSDENSLIGNQPLNKSSSEKKEEIAKYLFDVVKKSIKNYRLTKAKRKDYKKIYKMYIRSVAIYISKMTDSYADHRISKLINVND